VPPRRDLVLPCARDLLYSVLDGVSTSGWRMRLGTSASRASSPTWTSISIDHRIYLHDLEVPLEKSDLLPHRYTGS